MSDYKVPFINYGLAYKKIKPEIDREIQRVLAKGDLILRDDVEKFEKNLAKFVGTKYAVALNSGTDALLLSLLALGIERGKRVIAPSHTFVATIQVIVQLGAKIHLYDINEKVKDSIIKKADVYIITHLEGALEKIPKVDCPIVEDACQALGAIREPRTATQCWSFYPAKILGSPLGDAGALTTNNKKIYDYVKGARNHFKPKYDKWGINSRMDNVAAACLNIKLKYLPEVLKRREEIAKMYYEGLKDLEDMRLVKLPDNIPNRIWQDFVIKTEKRNELFNYLKRKGIETMKNEYAMPLPKKPLTAEYEAETLRIPCNETLTDNQIYYVITQIKLFYLNKWQV